MGCGASLPMPPKYIVWSHPTSLPLEQWSAEDVGRWYDSLPVKDVKKHRAAAVGGKDGAFVAKEWSTKFLQGGGFTAPQCKQLLAFRDRAAVAPAQAANQAVNQAVTVASPRTSMVIGDSARASLTRRDTASEVEVISVRVSPNRRFGSMNGHADCVASPTAVGLLHRSEMAHRGVTLAYLMELAEANVLDNLTIHQVVECFVRQRTLQSRCTMYDLVPAAKRGPPQFFVSHAWSRPLGSLVALLKEHFKVAGSNDEAAGVVIWLDFLAVNQHPFEERNSLLNDDVANLIKVIRTTDKTLLCCDRDCAALSRLWCLYEVWQTFVAGGASKLVLVMPAVDANKLKRAYDTIDMLQAGTTQPADRERIHKAITQSVGLLAVNAQIRQALVDAAVAEVESTTTTGVRLARMLDKAGTLLHLSGDNDGARPLYQSALETYVDTLGDQHPDTLRSKASFANCLNSLGKHDKAEPLLRDSLESHKRLLGSEHPDTASRMNDLATCISAKGEYAEAEPLLRRALEMRAALLGDEHLDTVNSMAHLAACMSRQGKRTEAERLMRLVLDLRERLVGDEHPDTIEAADSLAVCIGDQGRYAEAEPLYRRVMVTRTKVLGAQHLDTITSMNTLAVCVHSQARYAEAEPLYRQALQMRTAVLGAAHAGTGESMNNLGTCISDQGRYAEAETLLRSALDLRVKLFGEEHADVACSTNYLALCMYNQHKYDEAELLYRKALAIHKRLCGSEHPDTVSSMTSLATCLNAQGLHAEAETLLRTALEIRTWLLGSEHPDTASSMNNLAAGLSGQGRYAEAELLLRDALELRTQLLGEDHPDALNSLGCLATCVSELGRHAEAEPMFREAYEMSVRQLGKNHPDTITCASNLAQCLQARGKPSVVW